MKEYGLKEVAGELKMRTEAMFPALRLPLSFYLWVGRKVLLEVRKVIREEKGRIFLQNCHIRQIYKDHDLDEARGKLMDDGI